MQQMKSVSSQKGFTIIELVVVILLLGILAATALPRFMNIATEAHTGVARGLEGSFRSGLALFRATWTAQGQPAPNTVIAEGLRAAPGYTQAVVGDHDDDNQTPDQIITEARFGVRSSGYPYGTAALTLGADIVSGEITAAQCRETFNRLVELSGLTVGTGTVTINAASTTIDDIAEDIFDLQAVTATRADIYAFRSNGLIDTGIARDPVPNTVGDLLNETTEQPLCVYVYAAEAGNAERSITYVPWTGEVTFSASYDDLVDLLLEGAGDRVQ